MTLFPSCRVFWRLSIVHRIVEGPTEKDDDELVGGGGSGRVLLAGKEGLRADRGLVRNKSAGVCRLVEVVYDRSRQGTSEHAGLRLKRGSLHAVSGSPAGAPAGPGWCSPNGVTCHGATWYALQENPRPRPYGHSQTMRNVHLCSPCTKAPPPKSKTTAAVA